MAYIKQNFENGQTLKAEHLNHIEEGLSNIEKNRPCYVGTTIGEVLPETTVEIDAGDTGLGLIMTEIELVEGKTYTVIWNGTEYTCIAQDIIIPDAGISAGIGVGDINIVASGEPVTGEPFVIIDLSNIMVNETNGAHTMINALDDSTSVTLSILGEVEDVKRLDEKLLPESVPYAKQFDDVIMSEFPSSINEGGLFTDPVGSLIEGDIYKVNWGGTIYECTARKVESDYYGTCLALGNGYNVWNDGVYTTDPFHIMLFVTPIGDDGYTGVIYNGITPENNEFSVTHYLEVRKINKYCLPNDAFDTQILIVRVTSEEVDGNFVYKPDIPFVDVSTLYYDNETDTWSRMICLAFDAYADSAVYLPINMNKDVITFQRTSFNDIKLSFTKAAWYRSDEIDIKTHYVELSA